MSDKIMNIEVETGKLSFVEYRPYESTFYANSNAKVVMESQTGYLFPNRSMYAFDIQITTDATANCTSIGAGAIIDSISERLGGTQLESRRYNPLVYMADLATDLADQQVTHQDLNGFLPLSLGQTYNSTTNTSSVTYGLRIPLEIPKSSGTAVSVCVPFQSQLWRFRTPNNICSKL